MTHIEFGLKAAINAVGGVRSLSKAGRLQRACLELLREHDRNGDIPTNGRFLFYELEQRGVIPKKREGVNPKTGKEWKRTPLQDVSVATMHLRECGLVPWDWIEDETRTLSQYLVPITATNGQSVPVRPDQGLHTRLPCTPHSTTPRRPIAR